MPTLFDTHCHLASKEFDLDLPQILLSAQAADIGTIVTIATNLQNGMQGLEIQQKYSSEKLKIFASMGLHPHEAKDFTPALADQISAHIQSGNFVAVGETGIDYHYDFAPADIQKTSFDFHCELAITTGKPLIIHCRESVEDIYQILNSKRGRWSDRPGIMHCFSESWEWAQKFLDLGFYLSFGGIVTFKAGDNIRSVVDKVPVDKMLIETDAPYLAPVPHRGKRNEPAFIRKTFEMIAQVRSADMDQLAAQLLKNSQKLFAL